jgi:sugar lactone lactonase YvrE
MAVAHGMRLACTGPTRLGVRETRSATARFGPLLPLLTIGLLLLPAAPASGRMSASFLYPLASFAGPVPSQWARLAVDPERNEIYTLRPGENDVRIFDEHGMEVYAFEGFPSSRDITAGDDGDILILTRRYGASTIHRCNYRGEELSEITLKNVPDAFSSSHADRLVYRHGSLYLLDSGRLTVIVAHADGSFIRGHDLKATLWRSSNADEDERAARKLREISITGFDVDDDGNILFTISTLFVAYRFSPSGELQGWGRPGSGRGKFGIVAGIASAPTGHILVTDRLRSVVLIFDDDLAFQAEFGYRGTHRSNLISPDDVAIDADGNIYVSQAANRGVSVFRMIDE